MSRLPLLVFSHVVGTLNIVSVMAMAPLITTDFSLSATFFGTFISAYYGAQAMCALPAGAVTDRFGIGHTLVFSHIFMVTGSMIMALASGYVPCIFGMIFMGLGYSMTNPATARGVLEWFPEERRGLAMSIKQVGVPIGGVLAATNGALAAFFGWQPLMFVVGMLVALNGLVCLSLIRVDRQSTRRTDTKILANIADVSRNWNFNVFTFLSGLLNIGQTNFFGFLTLFMTEVVRTTQPIASVAIGLAQVTSALARIVLGFFSDRLYRGRRKLLKAWVCGAATLFLGMMVFVDDQNFGLWFVLLLTVGLGTTIAAIAPIAQVIAGESAPKKLAGTAIGYTMLGVHCGGFLGPIIFGMVMDAFQGSFNAGWLVTAMLTGVAVFLLIFVFEEKEPEH